MFNCFHIRNLQNPYQIARQQLRDDFDELVKTAAKTKNAKPPLGTKATDVKGAETKATETKTKVIKYALRTFLIIGCVGVAGLCGMGALKYKRLLAEASGPFKMQCMGRPILVTKDFRISELFDNKGVVHKISNMRGTYEYEGDVYTAKGTTFCQGQGNFIDTHAVTRRQGSFFNGVITEGEYHTAALVVKGKFYEGRLHGPVEGSWHDGRQFKGSYVHDLRHGSFEEKDASGIFYCNYDKGILLQCTEASSESSKT